MGHKEMTRWTRLIMLRSTGWLFLEKEIQFRVL
jgi:hypothetical protein